MLLEINDAYKYTLLIQIDLDWRIKGVASLKELILSLFLICML